MFFHYGNHRSNTTSLGVIPNLDCWLFLILWALLHQALLWFVGLLLLAYHNRLNPVYIAGSMSPIDYVNQILQGKKQLIVDDVTESEYVPFLVNRSLSYQIDCVSYANEMNRRSFIDKKL